MKLSKAIDGFMYTKAAQGRAPGTLADYTVNLTRFCKHLGDPVLEEITSDNIKEFFIFLQTYKFDPTNSGKPKTHSLKPKTISNAWTALSAFFGWCVEEIGINNPLTVKRIKFKEEPIVPFTEEEVRAMLKVCDYSQYHPSNRVDYKAPRPTRYRDKALIHVLFDTGVRVSELCGMRFSDVDLSNNRIRVTGKGKKDRYVYISKETAHVLWKYHTKRYINEEPDPSDFVFVDNDGVHQMTGNGVRQLLRRLGNKAGVQNVHPHRFRHSFAVAWLRNGGDAYTLMDVLGHTTMDMTRKYLNLAQNDIQRVHKRASPIANLYRK